MSTIHSFVQAAFVPVLGISLLGAVKTLMSMALVAGLLSLFKPLLLGVARALVLVVKPRLSKEQRLARRQMNDTMLRNRMLHAMDGSASSQAADLRALESQR
ncbi:MAG: hypothetical protein ACI83P_000615 [Janthinobacterium sp.]|jgi:hypothetical protein